MYYCYICYYYYYVARVDLVENCDSPFKIWAGANIECICGTWDHQTFTWVNDQSQGVAPFSSFGLHGGAKLNLTTTTGHNGTTYTCRDGNGQVDKQFKLFLLGKSSHHEPFTFLSLTDKQKYNVLLYSSGSGPHISQVLRF